MAHLLPHLPSLLPCFAPSTPAGIPAMPPAKNPEFTLSRATAAAALLLRVLLW